MKQKILFLAPRLHPNYREVFQELNKMTDSYYVVVGNSKVDILTQIETEKIIVIKKSWLNKLLNNRKDFPIYSTYLIPNIMAFLRLVLQIRPDKIIIRNSSPIVCVILLILYSKLTSKRLIYYSQSPIFKKTNDKKNLTRRLLFNFFDKRISPSKCKPYTENYENLPHRSNTEYIPFGLKSKREEPLSHKGIFKIVSIGKYEKRKNLDLVAEALNDLLENRFHLNLTIIGVADTDKRKEYYNNLKNQFRNVDNITFKVNLKRKEVEEELKNSKLFILASERETASISQLEAMSFGIPVIIGYDNGTAHYCEGAGTIVDYTRSKLVEAIKKYYSDREFYESKSKTALEDIKNYHDPFVIANKIRNL